MKAALFLFFLSPMVGELLSGSSPPASFFSVFGLTVMCLLYGGGAVLIRELAYRWNKGWPSIFALGAAYGILEEGIFCKSFFDPNWPDLLNMEGYGRWAGVNWVWSVDLTIYHTLVSIAIPIFLTNLVFPEKAREPWISDGWFAALSAMFVLDMLFCFLVLRPEHYAATYIPPLSHWLVTFAVVVGLYVLARRLPRWVSGDIRAQTKAPHPFFLGIIGLFLMVAFFLIPSLFRHFGVHFAVDILATIAIVSLVSLFIGGWAGGERLWSGWLKPALGIKSSVLISLLVFFLGVFVISRAKYLALPIIAVGSAAIVVVTRRMWRLSRLETVWSDLHVLALIFGALIPFMVVAFMRELRILNISPDESPVGMSIVGASAFVFLLMLVRKVGRRSRLPLVDAEQ